MLRLAPAALQDGERVVEAHLLTATVLTTRAQARFLLLLLLSIRSVGARQKKNWGWRTCSIFGIMSFFT